MANIQTFPMPDVGEGLTEAEILTWHVAVGDTLTVNQIMVEIETAKAAVELPSPYAGVVRALLVEPGITVDVGTPIISIDTDPGGSEAAAPTPELSSADSGEGGAKIGEMTADGRIATLVGYVSAGAATTRRVRKPGVAGPVDDLGFDLERVPRAAVPAAKVDSPASLAPTPPADAAAAAPVPAPVQIVPVAVPLVAEPAVAPQMVEPSVPAPPIVEPAVVVVGEQIGGAPDLPAPKATPPVRKLAKDLGVDLATVTPGRPDGVISRAEVEQAATGPRAVGAEAPLVAPTEHSSDGPPSYGRAPTPTGGQRRTSEGREYRVPIRGIRKITAQAMVASAFTAPHVTEFLTLDVTPMMELRDRLRKRPEFAEVRLSPLAFAAWAVCLASRKTPEINSVWDGDNGEILFRNYVNLGIAAATPRGLIVPVINDADQLDLHAIAVALAGLTAKARAGRTSPGEMSGGTFTITNVGIFGVDTGTPIINPGESAILALGSIKDAPWVVEGQLAVRKVCQLSLSFDHRVIDGQQGSQFLADVGALLADPGLSLVF